jgi:hypothetical protein
LVVVGGGLWLDRSLDNAQTERCQVAFGQIKLLQVEIVALKPHVDLTPEQTASVKKSLDDAVSWVTDECGPIPS